MEEERDIYNEPIKFVKKEINYSPGLKNIIEEVNYISRTKRL